jgi:hypothetical protein
MFGYIVQRTNEMLSPELTQLKRASTSSTAVVACPPLIALVVY